MTDSAFLSRVYDAKHRFEQENGCAPQYILLPEDAQNDLQKYIEEADRCGLLKKSNDGKNFREQIAGMLVLRNRSEGIPPLTVSL